MGLKNLQGWRLQSFRKQPVPLLACLQSEEVFPYIQMEPSLFQFMSIVSHSCTTRKSLFPLPNNLLLSSSTHRKAAVSVLEAHFPSGQTSSVHFASLGRNTHLPLENPLPRSHTTVIVVFRTREPNTGCPPHVFY